MKVPAPVAFAIIGIALVVAVGIGYRQYQEASAVPWQVSSAPVIDGDLPFHTEEEWTVLKVSQYIADLGALARNAGDLDLLHIQKTPSDSDISRYEVKWGKSEHEISLTSGVWNPVTYKPWAAEFFSTPDSATPDVSSMGCAKTLLDPSFKVFAGENTRLSEFLVAHPSSADAHLQAALLLGTIALNDYSGEFRDTRIPLNRMVAHLAAAEALGTSPAAPARLLAEGIRLTLCGQQAAALEAMASWPDIPELKEWKEILRLRNTLDWREGREAALKGGPALRYEYFRALANGINAASAVEFLKESEAEPDSTFWHIANETSLSVENGHVFSKPMLGIDLEEIAGSARHFGIEAVEGSLDWLKDYLDTPEGAPVTKGKAGLQVQVAGRNLMAGLQQRQFMQGAMKLFEFLNDNWGVSETASEFQTFLVNELPDMRYKPFLMRMNARTDKARNAANTPCEAVIHANPEMVTPELWASLRRDPNGDSVASAPDFHAWFHPEVPRGTAFDAGTRLFAIGVGDENDDAWMRELWARAPYDYNIAMHNAYLENGRSFNNLSGQIASKWLGPQSETSLKAMRKLANCHAGQPGLFEAAMEKIAALDPDGYIRLGAYFADRGMDDKAAAAYLKAFENANDRVAMANHSPWLVRHLFQHGDREMATQVAEAAAEVYSYQGLASYVWLMEAEGQWDKALETAVKIDERYNRGTPSCEIACLIRFSEADPSKAEAAGLNSKLARTFPDGLRKVGLEDFSEAPAKGVLINGSHPSMVPFSLAPNMVIVALNGYRTDTFAQYAAIRSISDDPAMSFIVWDGSSYRVSEGALPGRRFNVDMVDY